jgi:hypothetical protein
MRKNIVRRQSDAEIAVYVKSHLVYAKIMLENNVQGFIDFAEKSQS